jgi:hypothetical protein
MTTEPESERDATVADAAIADRAAYERECLECLERAAEISPEWVKRGCELLDARVAGRFPDTRICVRIRVPAWPQEVDDERSVWEDEGHAIRSTDDTCRSNSTPVSGISPAAWPPRGRCASSRSLKTVPGAYAVDTRVDTNVTQQGGSGGSLRFEPREGSCGFRALDVLPQEVVNAVDGWPVAEA